MFVHMDSLVLSVVLGPHRCTRSNKELPVTLVIGAFCDANKSFRVTASLLTDKRKVFLPIVYIKNLQTDSLLIARIYVSFKTIFRSQEI